MVGIAVTNTTFGTAETICGRHYVRNRQDNSRPLENIMRTRLVIVVAAALVLAASYGGQITGQVNDRTSGQLIGQTQGQASGQAASRVGGQTSGQDAPEYGPPKGTLVIVGGGSLEGTGIYEKFIQLAGGPNASFVIVPTAGGNKNADGTIREYKEEQVVAGWLKRGVKNVRMLHTHDPKVADTEDFAKILRTANAVWFDGGRQ